MYAYKTLANVIEYSSIWAAYQAFVETIIINYYISVWRGTYDTNLDLLIQK